MSYSKRRLRKRLWKAQGGKCFYCKRSTVLPASGDTASKPRTATLEHIVPLSLGGDPHPLNNCAVACFECNSARGNQPIEQFVEKRSANT